MPPPRGLGRVAKRANGRVQRLIYDLRRAEQRLDTRWGGPMFRAEGEDISFIYFSEISLRILGYFSKFLCPNQNIFAPAVRQV